MKKIYFLIGASGAGKTTALKSIESLSLKELKMCYFDSIGVPSFEDMEKEHGSTDEWQRATTIEWIRRMKEMSTQDEVILDGQTRPSFIHEGCEKYGVKIMRLFFSTVPDSIRKERLEARKQPELASEGMMDWARRLREACQNGACTIIDNSDLSMEETQNSLLKALNR